MRIVMDYNNMTSSAVPDGVSPADFAAAKAAADRAAAAMPKLAAEGRMDWRALPSSQAEVSREIIDYADQARERFDAFVVLGIGGSALGPMAVQQAVNHPYYNELSREDRGGYPRFYVADNVDPERLSYLFDILDLRKTLFNVISKSGSTSETMSQFMIIKDRLERELGAEAAASNIVVTTDREKGALTKIAREGGYKTFYIPAGVGGRFSELCPVGLLPAAMCGVDIEELLAGAAYMDAICSEPDATKNPAYMYALLNYIGMKKGKPISVMMPYADSLKYMADWYAQLWAESLGKAKDRGGRTVNAGPTPVKALGVTDQHSQVQLYAEGPFDKMIVFLAVGKFRRETAIPRVFGDAPNLAFLGGHTHSELISVERAATEYALMKSGKMNMTITLPEVNAFTVGQLLQLFEVATAFCGELLDINAFDQPGVEGGKNAAYAMFGRPGYEAVRAELDARPAKDAKFII
jgi:glucose-6-phosphate isomerase